MLFLLFTITFQLWTGYTQAQKFRMDYMWANAFSTYYRLHDLATDWNQARQICEAEGTALLIPDSLDELENLKLLMSNMKAHSTAVFIGLHDRFSDGNFVTLKGEPVTGTVLELLWAPGSPDNKKGEEHCVVMTREGLFDDEPCTDIYPFVCKILGNDTNFNKVCNNYDMVLLNTESGASAMLFLLFTITFQLWTGYTQAQKFRMDYMWANAFSTYYRLHDLATDWNQARQICEAEGTALLIPDSLDELENLKLLMSNMKAHSTAVFIGLHDRFSDGNFVTLKGEPVTGTVLELLWAPGSPDNKKGEEHCVVMTREGLFDDEPCTDIYPFVCKILGNDTNFNKVCNNYDMGYAPAAKDNGKCYKFHVEPLSWHDAYLICQEEEGHLAIATSDEEATLITGYLSNHLESKAPNPNVLLIGFSDLMFPFEYRTLKGDSLSKAGYSLWGPFMDNISEMTEKRCGAISRTGQLLMVSCDVPAMFLCEKTVNETTFGND